MGGSRVPPGCSYADVVEWLTERGIIVDPRTVYDWVRAFTPRCIEAARAYRSQVGVRWRVDETDITVGQHWHDLFRAIDEQGQSVAVYLSQRRNKVAAQTFCEAAIGGAR